MSVDQAVHLGSLSWQARALLHDPDRRTRWVVVVSALLGAAHPDLDDAVARLHETVPMMGARLVADRWIQGPVPPVQVLDDDLLSRSELVARFDLSAGPPIRILSSPDHREIAIAGHHVAFDGLGLIAVLSGLLGGPVPPPVGSRPRGRSEGLWPGIRRVARPAHPVARTPDEPVSESLLSRRVRIEGGDVTARLAAASEAAAAAHNHRRGAPWRRVGISIGVAGPEGLGYVSSFRRVDLRHGDDVASRVRGAISSPDEPFILVRGGRVMRSLAPLSRRASDSLLVSNVGRHALPGVTELRFFPVARGRSAVAVGAGGVTRGSATVTLRTLHLARDDAESLLEGIVSRSEGWVP